jgi:hypothetical protein
MKERTASRRQPRPVYYTREQLDELCEQIIGGFCMERYGQELTPIPTETLQLLEEHAADVDQTADLPDGPVSVFWHSNWRKPNAGSYRFRQTRRRAPISPNTW